MRIGQSARRAARARSYRERLRLQEAVSLVPLLSFLSIPSIFSIHPPSSRHYLHHARSGRHRTFRCSCCLCFCHSSAQAGFGRCASYPAEPLSRALPLLIRPSLNLSSSRSHLQEPLVREKPCSYTLHDSAEYVYSAGFEYPAIRGWSRESATVQPCGGFGLGVHCFPSAYLEACLTLH